VLDVVRVVAVVLVLGKDEEPVLAAAGDLRQAVVFAVTVRPTIAVVVIVVIGTTNAVAAVVVIVVIGTTNAASVIVQQRAKTPIIQRIKTTNTVKTVVDTAVVTTNMLCESKPR